MYLIALSLQPNNVLHLTSELRPLKLILANKNPLYHVLMLNMMKMMMIDLLIIYRNHLT